MEREKDIEKYLAKKIQQVGGLCWKFTSPGMAGVPDRIIVLNGKVVFCELKRPDGQLRSLQLTRFRQIRQAGGKCFKVSTKHEADLLVDYLNGTL